MQPSKKVGLLSEGKARFETFMLPSMREAGKQHEATEKWEKKDVPTKSMPVFYNPDMVLNRDLSVIVVHDRGKKGIGGLSIADVMCGIGIRGIRYLVEGTNVENTHVSFVDLNPPAILACKRNLELNGIPPERATLATRDANVFLFEKGLVESERLDVVDIDPFGNPMHFMTGALKAMKKRDALLQVTATDLAVLAGVHWEAARRKYDVHPLRHVSFHAEVQARILLGAMFKKAMEIDMTIKPRLSVARRHYIKVVVEKISGATRANADMEYLGYIIHCKECKNHFTVQQDEMRGITCCPRCKSPKVDFGGPLWTGILQDVEYCKNLDENAPSFQYLKTKREAFKILRMAGGDGGQPPGSHDIHEIAHELKARVMPVKEMLGRLQENGYSGVQDAFNPVALKTTAPREAIASILKENSSR